MTGPQKAFLLAGLVIGAGAAAVAVTTSSSASSSTPPARLPNGHRADTTTQRYRGWLVFCCNFEQNSSQVRAWTVSADPKDPYGQWDAIFGPVTDHSDQAIEGLKGVIDKTIAAGKLQPFQGVV